jgi:hypothetical protein
LDQISSSTPHSRKPSPVFLSQCDIRSYSIIIYSYFSWDDRD